jgi:hypothetical protein
MDRVRLVALFVWAVLGCASEPRPVAEGRPPAFIGTPGPARPDGCRVQLLLSRQDRPAAAIEDIATVSAEAYTLDACKHQLVEREACRYGGDVLYAFETGQASVGLETKVVWCAAKLARWAGPPPAGR